MLAVGQLGEKPDAAEDAHRVILEVGPRHGAQSVVHEVVAATEGLAQVPTYYFTQLLGVALGLDPELCRLDLNGPAAQELLVEKNFIAAAAV